MSDYVIVVPKQDELIAMEWAFSTTLGRPDARTSAGVELFRRHFPFGDVTFALLDKQTNTYSSLLTATVIDVETPRLIFLAGTALGRPDRTPVGSLVVSDGIIDISEKRYGEDGSESYVPQGPTKSAELTLDAKDFISRRFNKERAHSHLRSMARRPTLLRGAPKMNEFIQQHEPTVLCEAIVSGNEYRMGGTSAAADRIWSQTPTARAYDMEAAGFALAAAIKAVPWLVVRGISDHGTAETKNDYHRALGAGLAGRFLFEFLSGGLVRAAQLPERWLNDEAYRLDGTWVGAMAYLDDNGEPVVFAEQVDFTQTGSDVRGIVRSRRISGGPRHDELEYRMSFSLASHGYAGAVWSETEAARQYFGVMMAEFDEDSTVLRGAWMGTSKNGVRQGYFRWHNTERDGKPNAKAAELATTVADLIACFSRPPLKIFNDACNVAS